MPALSIFMLLFLNSVLAASTYPAGTSFANPVARMIPPHSIYTLTPYTFVVNGSFAGSDLRYSATLADGSELPYWMELSESDGSFSIFAPPSTLGEIHQIKVTARDAAGLSASTTFYLNVTDSSPDCMVSANSDRLGKIISCTGDSIRLRGDIHSNLYRWTGPNGFTSNEKEPQVTVPGIYVLTTDEDDALSCPTSDVVEVVKITNCNQDSLNNLLPAALIKTDLTTGVGPLTVHFDASSTRDTDGSVLRYLWSWEGGAATGIKPTVTFPEGDYEVFLTVTDDRGARATDRINIVVLPIPAYTTYWLEAECAAVGENWAIASTTSASGGDYATPLRNSTSSAPADLPANQVRFTVTDAKEATFELHARVNAYSMMSDSYYVRVNGGAWYAWKAGMTQGQGFQWNKMPQLIDLKAGTNTIDFAYREANTRLDKLFLTAEGEEPSGMGGEDRNCRAPNLPPLAIATADVVTGTAPLSVTLDASHSLDTDGMIASYHWSWAYGEAEGIDPFVTLPEGSHLITLTVTDDAGAEDVDQVLIVVEGAPMPPMPDAPSEPTTDTDKETGSDEFWLEAECAAVGSRWSEKSSTSASAGKYVVVPTGNSTAAPPADIADNQVRFTLSASTAGAYFLFARVNAPSSAMDSYWVRVNDGAWYKWNSGVRRGNGFNWTKLPATLSLEAGTNTVDFSFRESGTQLDKIYVTLKDQLPTGLGEAATNCGTVTAPVTALEAECALENTGWTTAYSNTAAGGSYLVYGGERTLSAPTDAAPGNQLTFEVEARETGLHHLYLRLDAPDPTRNSIWVQIDYGEWILFWKETTGDQILTQGFEWRELTNDGRALTFELAEGYHTIRLANRESGTRVDKLLLTTDATLPTGFGPEAGNCNDGSGSEGVSMQTMFSSTVIDQEPVIEEVSPEASIFPNPAIDRLTLDLSSSHTGPVDLIIYDTNGRRIRQEQFLKDGTQSRTELSVGSLPSGVYHLRVIEGDRATTQSFVVGR